MKKEQRSWIKFRDKDALRGVDLENGTSSDALQYEFNLQYLTKDRCYVLVKKYMK
ncbi:lysozyme inhibitor LprI family protein [Saccharibacillus deserti]|uniref:lysozyme inhibitor LprI family protein n=1 Tax=Saccharibacillus deserti TaxID=1634444 RepID=UPI001C63200A